MNKHKKKTYVWVMVEIKTNLEPPVLIFPKIWVYDKFSMVVAKKLKGLPVFLKKVEVK